MASGKMCDECGEAPAVVHMKEIDNQVTREIDLCRDCAEKRGYVTGSSAAGPIQDLAEKLVSMAKDVSDRRESEGIRCPACGMFYSEFTKTARLGCADCYESFLTQLKPLLRKTHGSTRHVGRRPVEEVGLHDERRELRRLRTEMQRAIRREEYESAAELRDQIQRLEEATRDRQWEDGNV